MRGCEIMDGFRILSPLQKELAMAETPLPNKTAGSRTGAVLPSSARGQRSQASPRPLRKKNRVLKSFLCFHRRQNKNQLSTLYTPQTWSKPVSNLHLSQSLSMAETGISPPPSRRRCPGVRRGCPSSIVLLLPLPCALDRTGNLDEHDHRGSQGSQCSQTVPGIC